MEHASNSPPSSPDINKIVGAPQLGPRLGHEYQAEIPPLLKESERLQLLTDPADSDGMQDNSLSFALGLPISVIQIPKDAEDNEHDSTINAIELAKAANTRKSSIFDNEEARKKPTTVQFVMKGDSKSGQLHESKKYVMAPGTSSDSWTDADAKSFLLGLFIFGKNFAQIKRFLENKSMGEILSFYYGKFYKSNEYRRWSCCRKIKGRKCVTGQKLFTGQRQNELLSRVIPKVSEESRDQLLQISKSYTEGRVSLEAYVSSLKSTVGLDVLVEAVGIGKEKEDLTKLGVEPVKKNRMCSAPNSKAWSSLGPDDIVKFLSGGFQLSKAKANNIFWEAVWPRLLARGWHFEQPKNQGFVSTKDYLVFLIPGVKKFSRRNLVKGDHYFDSVSDLVSKVVAEPNLLLLEEEAKCGSCNEKEPEKGLLNEDDQSDYLRCYLKPQASTFNSDNKKFMVIDTSLKRGRNSSGLRKLKCLPGKSVHKVEVDAAGITCKGAKHMSKANHKKGMSKGINQKLTNLRELKTPRIELEDSSKLISLSNKSRPSNGDFPSKVEPGMPIYGKKNSSNTSKQKSISERRDRQIKAYDNQYSNGNKMIPSHQNQKTCEFDDNRVKRTIKFQPSQGARLDYSKNAVKRRRLSACAKDQGNQVLENSVGSLESDKLAFSQSPSFPDANKIVDDPVDHKQNGDRSLTASSADRFVEKYSEEGVLNGTCHGISTSPDKVEKCGSRVPDNSKVPQVPRKSEDGEVMAGQCLNASNPCSTSDTYKLVEEPPRTSDDAGSSKRKPDINPRRQSTRSRPLSVRALESLANESLHVQRRNKRKDIETHKDAFSPCRKAQTGNKTIMNHRNSGHGTAVSVEEEYLNGSCSVRKKIC